MVDFCNVHRKIATNLLISSQNQNQSTNSTCLKQYQLKIQTTSNQIMTDTQNFNSVFIRHAQSHFNKGGYDYVEQFNLHGKVWLQLIQDHSFNKAVTYNPAYIDPEITDYGIQQVTFKRYSVHFAKSQFNPEQIDIIFVSPQLRALQTCQHIFGHDNPKVIVHPLVTEVVRYSCDVSHVMAEKIHLFPHYNFEEMKNWTDEWYFQVLSEQKRQICKQYFEKHQIHDFKGRQLAVIELLSNGIISESAQELRQRVGRLKDMIQEFKEKKGAKKIAVVSHHYTTQCLLSPGFDSQGNVLGIGQIQNGKPYFRNFNEVYKVR